ncbi:hypothetical protein BWI96_05635 [Siphonobacter sp. SORGH_AS_0500]|uniref:DUF4365 domain-containing protein n=1 Tax=Siphonobacter sp. SORGH_AS_0500 TaxID=1864824 RepID=UPI000CB8CF46|nr:DUF4365 domain-containing protein [Siphonobacter sp. SORGH_AS_0500]PKK37357.1 hypothetical protein BWI96_05635 [Siphonobacter sp. SORGH_AS_0500]
MKKNNLVDNYRRKDIQKQANRLLEDKINELKHIIPDYYLNLRSQEDQDDKGIDFECEIEQRTTGSTSHLFKIQNKGSSKALSPLTETNNLGHISYSIKIRNAKYYRNEVNIPVVFIVCDLVNKKVYWHSIQLDDSIDERIIAAEKNNKKSISIYINPSKFLNTDTARLFIADLLNSHVEQHERYLQSIDRELFDIPKVIHINSDDSILNQLYSFINQLYSEITIVPISFIARSYPFSINDINSYYNIETFSLRISNESVFEFFNSIDILEDTLILNIKNSDQDSITEKVHTILYKLNSNLIYTITNKNGENKKNIKLNTKSNCDCCICNYYSFNFAKIDYIINTSDSIDTLNKKAYTAYLIGEYLDSFNIYIALLKTLTINNKTNSILYYIVIYNLNKLVFYVKTYNYDVYFNNKYFYDYFNDRLMKVTYEKMSLSYREYIVSKIHRESIIINSYFTINKVVSEIIDHYRSQLRGGMSMNDNISKLIYEYAFIERFVSSNRIIGTLSQYYIKIHELFIEGLFASHGINNKHYHRLKYFDDWTLLKMMIYGNGDDILKFYNRYELNGLKYKINNNGYNEFLSKSISLIENSNFVYNGNSSIKINYKLSRSLDDMIDNSIILFAITDFDERSVIMFYKEILNYIINTNRLSFKTLKYFKLLIRKKHSYFTSDLITDLLNKSIINSIFHDEDYFESLTYTITKNHKYLKISNELQTSFLDEFITKPNQSSHVVNRLKILIFLYKLNLSTTTKDIIKFNLIEYIDNEFDFGILSYSLLLDVIPLEEKYIDKLINFINIDNLHGFEDFFSTDNPIRSLSLNMLINICYKFNINFDDIKFYKFRNINNYYDWLLNMEKFDYNKFNPTWIVLYETYYYHMQLLKYPVIKNKTDEFLIRNNNYQLQKEYHKIFYELPKDE